MEEKKKKKILKGDYGYINNEKKKQLIRSIVAFLIAAGIFVLGLALNKWQKNNIFTILAALAVLPAAKILIRYILFFPYRTPSEEFRDRLLSITGDYEGVIFDALMTTTENPLGFEAAVVTQHYIICKKQRPKDKTYKMNDALTKIVKGWGYPNKIVICEDDESFFKEVNNRRSELFMPEVEEGVEDSIRTLLKNLLILVP